MRLTEQVREKSGNWKKIWFHESKGFCCVGILPCENCQKVNQQFNFLFSVHRRGFFSAVLCNDCAFLVFKRDKSVIVRFADLLVLNEGMKDPNLVKVQVVASLPLDSKLIDPFMNVVGYGGKDETIFSAALKDSDVTVDNTVLAGRESFERCQIGLGPDSSGKLETDRDEDVDGFLLASKMGVPLLGSDLNEERLLARKANFFPLSLTDEERGKLGLLEKKSLR